MRRFHEIVKEGPIYFLLNAFLGAYNRRTDVIARGGSGGDGEKLEMILKQQATIIDMLSPLGSLPSTVGLMETRLETIHGLITDLSADPEKAKQLSERIRKQVEALKSAKPKSD